MKVTRVLVACEFSGIVREEFRKLGHQAVSIDLLPSEKGSGPHYQMDILEHLEYNSDQYDLMIAFPPCTHLASSGARWFPEKIKEQKKAIEFVWQLMNADIPKIALENPIGILSTEIRKPDQIIQPYWFGHGETKQTCFWLKNLPKLVPTKRVAGRLARVHKEPPSEERWKNRSRTYPGIAEAMARQWSKSKSLLQYLEA